MSEAGGRRPRLAAVVVSSGVAVLLVGCNPSTKAAGEGRLEPGSQVLLTTGGGQPMTSSRSRPLQSGDTIEVFQGTAKVTLPGGQVLELQPRSVLVLDQGPELRSGDLLVTAASTGTSVIRAAGSEVRVSGAARITFAPSLRVVAYQGTSTLRSGARQIDVPALRSADVSLPGLLPGRPSPLTLDRADPWAGRFLREALDGEAGLESRSRGFTSQVGANDASSPAFYSNLLPGLAAQEALPQELVDRFGPVPPDTAVQAGEVLIGSVIALQGQRATTFADRLAGAAAFRAEGASWALVAVDQQVPSVDEVLRMVDAAVNVAPLELAAPAPTAPPPTLPRPAPTARPANPRSAPAPNPTSTTRPAQRRTSPTQAPPTSAPPAGQLDPLLDATVDPVVGLLTDLLDGG